MPCCHKSLLKIKVEKDTNCASAVNMLLDQILFEVWGKKKERNPKDHDFTYM